MALLARPPVRAYVRSAVHMDFDLAKELGYDTETGGQPWDPAGYALKPGALHVLHSNAPIPRPR